MSNNKPYLVFVSQTDTFSALKPQLTDYQIIIVSESSGYMNTLIETRAVMIFIDGLHPDWQRFATTPKTSPATRRIPIVMVSDDVQQRSDATVVGADLTFTIA